MKKFLMLIPALLLALAGCDGDCANGHCHTSPAPVVVVDAPAPAPATTVADPVPAPAPADPVITPAPVATAPTTGGIKRAVLVGINKFLDPGAPPLTGCVPDVARAYAKCTGNVGDTRAHFGAEVDVRLIQKCAINSWGFDPDCITLLLNEQATVANVKKALEEAVANSKPGDTLLYWQSSHGTEDTIPDDNNATVHGMICCYDFAWDREHEICDVDLKAIFSKLPDGVIFNHVSDSCNSGNLDKNVGHHKHPIREKAIPPPAAVRQRIAAARAKNPHTRGIVNGELDVGYLPGCKADQTSADSEDDDGFPGGALSIMLIKNVDAYANQPLTDLAKKIDADLAADGYDQVCVPFGARKNKPFLKN